MSSGQVLVVGGTRGLGKVITDRFLARSLDVTVLSRTPVKLQGVHHVATDLELLSNAEEIVAEVTKRGPLQYLCFCQRFRGEGDPWQGELQVGLNATRLLVEGFASHFASHGDRAIAVVSSVYADYVGGSQPLGYHVVKAGLNQMVRYFSWEMGRRGIRANAILPLTYVKPENRAYYESDEKLESVYERLVPLRRMGDAEDSANVVDFLCSDKAGFVNGQCILVDGGVSVMWPEHVAREFSNI